MPIEMLWKEVQGLPDEMIMEAVHFIRFLKLEQTPQPEDMSSKRRALVEKYAGKIVMSDDFDAPIC